LLLRGREAELGVIALDESHTLGNSFNGALLELLLTKLKFLETTSSHRVQIVALSATIGNINQLTRWLNARLFETTFRTVPLTCYIKAGQEILDIEGRLL
jgi:replicative superfamily II helicase